MKTIQKMTRNAFGRMMAIAAAFVMTVTMINVPVVAATPEAVTAGGTIATVGTVKFIASQDLVVDPDARTMGDVSFASTVKSNGKNNAKVGSSTARVLGYLTATETATVDLTVYAQKAGGSAIYVSDTDLQIPAIDPGSKDRHDFSADTKAAEFTADATQKITLKVEAGKYYYVLGVGCNIMVCDIAAGSGSTTTPTTPDTKPTTPDTTPSQPSASGAKIATSGAIDSYFTLNGKAVDDAGNSGKYYTLDGTPVKSTGRIKLGGTGTANSISFTTTSTATVEVWAISGTSTADSKISLFDANGTEVATGDAYATQTKGYVAGDTATEYGKKDNSIEVTVSAKNLAAGTYTIASPKDAAGSVNVYYVRVTESAASTDDKKEETKPEVKPDDSKKDLHLKWDTVDGKSYWYENGVKQGTNEDKQSFIFEGTIRGREIFDAESNGWYWLDACFDGAKAVDKEVFMPYVYSNELNMSADEVKGVAALSNLKKDDKLEDGTVIPNTYDMSAQIEKTIKAHQANPDSRDGGKWVRYDSKGAMIKGWYTADATLYPTQKGNCYFYDYKTGLMAKGMLVIDGVEYKFDEVTGVCTNPPAAK